MCVAIAIRTPSFLRLHFLRLLFPDSTFLCGLVSCSTIFIRRGKSNRGAKKLNRKKLSYAFVMMSVLFWPPKPKLLDMQSRPGLAGDVGSSPSRNRGRACCGWWSGEDLVADGQDTGDQFRRRGGGDEVPGRFDAGDRGPSWRAPSPKTALTPFVSTGRSAWCPCRVRRYNRCPRGHVARRPARRFAWRPRRPAPSGSWSVMRNAWAEAP